MSPYVEPFRKIIYISRRKSTGPSALPCGRPTLLVTGIQADSLFSSITRRSQEVLDPCYRTLPWLHTAYDFSSVRRRVRPWGTESKALLKSRYITSRGVWTSSILVQTPVTSRSWVTQEPAYRSQKRSRWFDQLFWFSCYTDRSICRSYVYWGLYIHTKNKSLDSLRLLLGNGKLPEDNNSNGLLRIAAFGYK